jgi:hypothetical protein
VFILLYVAPNWKQMFFNRWLVKQTMVHAYYRIVSRDKEQTSDTCINLVEPPEDYAAWKKSIPKACIPCESM